MCDSDDDHAAIKRKGAPPSLNRAEQRAVLSDLQARSSEQELDLLMTVLDSMTDGVWLVDAQGGILLANHAAKDQMKELNLYPESSFVPDMLNYVEVLTPDGRPLGMETLFSVLEGHPLKNAEIRVRNKTSGKTFYRRLSMNRVVDKEGKILGAFVLVQDITGQKHAEKEKARLEKQLHQAQKMEAIGTLAGGIAHDFNNVLAIILGNAELAIDDLKDNSDVALNINQIINASKRARDLIKQILVFSRKTEPGKNRLKLAPLLEETYNMLRATLLTTIRMDLNIDAKSDTVLADASQIQQIIINLAGNAAYAMKKTGGILTIDLSAVTVKQAGQIQDAEVPPGSYAKLSVKDTGVGMTDKVKRRIFDPFFTTKKQGEGTGMGLAVVYGIVRNLQGDITVESEIGKGSTFNIFLPLVSDENLSEWEDEGLIPRGRERVLLVDDEPGVLKIVSQMLERLGCHVRTAAGGLEAWNIFEKETDAFDLVITDQIMPDLTGAGLARKIRAVKPDLPIIVLTGYAEETPVGDETGADINAFVMKPVTTREIAGTIRKVMTQTKKPADAR